MIAESGGLHHKTPGWLAPQLVRCGKRNCRCASGQKHGPYLVRFWREGGRQRRVYVRIADQDAVRAELGQARREEARPWEMRQLLAKLRQLAKDLEP